MALLNFISKYENVAKYKDLTASSPSLSGSAENDYVKLIFTEDGHIITHGTDYIPWGKNGIIPINRLPIADGNNPDNEHLWDSATINQKINDSYVINSAMRFKGTIGLNPTYNGTSDTNKYLVNNVKSGIPSAQVGDTYRVTKSGNYEGFQCEAGDLLMCITASGTNKAAEWTVAQTNINGTVDFVINGKVHKIYSNDTSGLTMFAPVEAGTSGHILVSTGDKAPTWKNPASLTVGTANKVSNSLSNGAGIIAFSYDGSSAKKIALAPATATTIGGVIVDAAGDKATISVDANGKISLTATNVRNALGYDPVGVNNWRPVHVDGVEFQGGATNTGNLSIKHGLGITITKDAKTHDITFNANTNYTTSGKNYKVEADSTTGGLYVNVPWSNTTYGIVSSTLDGLAPKVIDTNTTLINNAFYLLASSNGTATPSWYKLPANAFANTWRDIKIDGVSIGSSTLNLIKGDHITLSNTNGTVQISSTWRDIKIGNSSIGDKTLNIDASGDIYVAKTETDDTVTIDFGISWYNLDTNEYEHV